MSFYWGKASKERLEDLAPVMVKVLDRALSYGIINLSVAQTRRDQYEQDTYWAMGLSKCKWPDSKHNVSGKQKYARASDIYPWVNGKASIDPLHVAVMVGVIMAAAAEEGVEVRSGANWDCDFEFYTDQTFVDGFHFQLK